LPPSCAGSEPFFFRNTLKAKPLHPTPKLFKNFSFKSLQLLVKGHVSLQPLSKEGGLLAGSGFHENGPRKKVRQKIAGMKKPATFAAPLNRRAVL
jgi:hypothetical protein